MNSTVEHRYNEYGPPELLDTQRPSIGLSEIAVSESNGRLHCVFTRAKKLESNSNTTGSRVSLHADLDNAKFYLLVAMGQIGSDGEPNIREQINS